ncbi:MAG: hypothetical protein GXO83_08900 [Chlorobi bacterium]|nr:hypothetical protein [Chlorobiota bacterium]
MRKSILLYNYELSGASHQGLQYVGGNKRLIAEYCQGLGNVTCNES